MSNRTRNAPTNPLTMPHAARCIGGDKLARLCLIAAAGGALIGCSTTNMGYGAGDTPAGLGVVASRPIEDDGEIEMPISLADLPPAVRQALAGITSDASVTQVTRDEEDGQTSYDVEYTKDGAAWAVEFEPDGAVIENEPDGDDDGDDE